MTNQPETSDSLLIRVRDLKDREAWNQFDAIYRPMVYRIARRAGWQDSDADDISQRVMLSVSKAIPDWEKDPSKGSFRSWLATIARNSIVSMLRGRRPDSAVGGTEFLQRSMTVEAGESEIDEVIEQEHLRARLRFAAEEIRSEFTQPSWDAFWLTTLGQLSVTDAAARLGQSVGSVYAARSRIMRRLQQHAGEIKLEGEE